MCGRFFRFFALVAVFILVAPGDGFMNGLSAKEFIGSMTASPAKASRRAAE